MSITLCWDRKTNLNCKLKWYPLIILFSANVFFFCLQVCVWETQTMCMHMLLCCSRPCWRQQRPHCSLTIVSPPSSSSELDLTDGGNSMRAQLGPVPSPPPLPQACSVRLSTVSMERPTCRLSFQVSTNELLVCMWSHFHAMLWIYTC